MPVKIYSINFLDWKLNLQLNEEVLNNMMPMTILNAGKFWEVLSLLREWSRVLSIFNVCMYSIYVANLHRFSIVSEALL